MADTQTPPEKLIASIPEPDTLRLWLKQTNQLSGLLRSLLRVAEQKQKCYSMAKTVVEGAK